MALDIHSLRRRAAYSVLSKVLSEAELESALSVLPDTLHNEQLTSIIAFIDRVASLTMLDTMTCKRLYGELYRALSLPIDQLPADPWAGRLAGAETYATAPARPFAQTQATPAYVPPPPPPAPVAVAPAPAAVSVAPAPTPEPESKVKLSAAQTVLLTLAQTIRANLQQHHPKDAPEFRSDLQTICKRRKYKPETSALLTKLWENLTPEAWEKFNSEKAMGDFAHCLYQTLCETLGPVDADTVLARAVEKAGSIPAAKEFPPANFL